MNDAARQPFSRRSFLANSGRVAAASALAGAVVSNVHAAEEHTLQIALVGCGGRGTGAVKNAFQVPQLPVKLVAMADVFENRLRSSHENLSRRDGDKVDVPEERRFLGFDAYKKAMDCLRPGDVVILATPPAFRWVHYTYAIEKGLNVFMEKPVTVDGPSSRRMLELNKKALEKNLKVAVGLMCRHCKSRGELAKRIRDGEIGDIVTLRCYRMSGGGGFCDPNPGGMSDLMYQISKFHSFLWLSGGAYSDFLIHNIDECCWMKDAWPVEAIASGGRHYREKRVDQNFDNYSVEYTFPDGTKMFLFGRQMSGCYSQFASFAHGSKAQAVVSTSAHYPAKCRIYKNHDMTVDPVWSFPQPEPNPYDLEWVDLVDAIVKDKPYNEVERGVEASLVTVMGRMAAHTGQAITRDQMLAHDVELGAGVDQLTLASDSPLMPKADGSYAVPMPGLIKTREY